MNKKAICILSGGMDSTLASYMAKNDGYEIMLFILIMDKEHRIEN